MNQVMAFFRQAAPFISGILVTFGIITNTQQTAIEGIIAGIVGVVTQIIAFYLSWKANTDTSILTAAAQIPEVKRIEVAAPPLATAAERDRVAELVKDTPPEVVASTAPRP